MERVYKTLFDLKDDDLVKAHKSVCTHVGKVRTDTNDTVCMTAKDYKEMVLKSYAATQHFPLFDGTPDPSDAYWV